MLVVVVGRPDYYHYRLHFKLQTMSLFREVFHSLVARKFMLQRKVKKYQNKLTARQTKITFSFNVACFSFLSIQFITGKVSFVPCFTLPWPVALFIIEHGKTRLD